MTVQTFKSICNYSSCDLFWKRVDIKVKLNVDEPQLPRQEAPKDTMMACQLAIFMTVENSIITKYTMKPLST